MSDLNGRAPGLSDEDVARIERGKAEMIRRRREGDYRPPPLNPAKLKSMAPGMHIVPPSPTEPPTPSPADESDGEHPKKADPRTD